MPRHQNLGVNPKKISPKLPVFPATTPHRTTPPPSLQPPPTHHRRLQQHALLNAAAPPTSFLRITAQPCIESSVDINSPEITSPFTIIKVFNYNSIFCFQ